MKKLLLQAFLLLFVVFASCSKTNSSDSPPPPPPPAPPAPTPPTINSFSPIHALPGASITITGTNFSSVTASNAVKINGTDAAVSAATASQLTVTVPAGATTGKISITVSSLSATSTDDFEVIKDIPRNGLIAFYSFAGNANDASGNSLHGTVSGATLAADRYGNTSKAYSFDGISNYITFGNPAALKISNKITIACWAKTAAIDYKFMLSKYIDFGDGKKGYVLEQENVSSQGRFAMYLNDVPGLNYLSGNFNANEWVFMAITLDGKHIVNYMNGTSVMDADQSPLLTDCADAELVAGANSLKNAKFFKGAIDDITIYNRMLTAGEITQLYQQTVTKY